jgi:hypothetical protein
MDIDCHGELDLEPDINIEPHNINQARWVSRETTSHTEGTWPWRDPDNLKIAISILKFEFYRFSNI